MTDSKQDADAVDQIIADMGAFLSVVDEYKPTISGANISGTKVGQWREQLKALRGKYAGKLSSVDEFNAGRDAPPTSDALTKAVEAVRAHDEAERVMTHTFMQDAGMYVAARNKRDAAKAGEACIAAVRALGEQRLYSEDEITKALAFSVPISSKRYHKFLTQLRK